MKWIKLRWERERDWRRRRWIKHLLRNCKPTRSRDLNPRREERGGGEKMAVTIADSKGFSQASSLSRLAEQVLIDWDKMILLNWSQPRVGRIGALLRGSPFLIDLPLGQRSRGTDFIEIWVGWRVIIEKEEDENFTQSPQLLRIYRFCCNR